MNAQGDVLRFVGSIEMQLADEYGSPVGPRMGVKNLVVEGGRAWIGAKIQSSSPPATTISHIAVGTSSIPTVGTMTALVSELARAAIGSMVTTTLTGATPYWSALGTFGTNEANGAIGEIGLFTSSSGGVMVCRAITTISKTSTNTLNYTYVLSF